MCLLANMGVLVGQPAGCVRTISGETGLRVERDILRRRYFGGKYPWGQTSRPSIRYRTSSPKNSHFGIASLTSLILASGTSTSSRRFARLANVLLKDQTQGRPRLRRRCQDMSSGVMAICNHSYTTIGEESRNRSDQRACTV